MADASGTIIIGKLDDSEFQRSIDTLINTVKEKTTQMATSFDDAMTKITNSIKNLSTVSASSTTQSNARVESMKKEAQAAKETAMTYDQMAQAVQRVVKDNTGIRANFNKEELIEYHRLLRQIESEYVRMNMSGTANSLTNEKMQSWIVSLRNVIQKYELIIQNIERANNTQAFFDGSKMVRGLTEANEALKRMSAYYAELEKEDQKRIAAQTKAEAAANKQRIAQIEAEKRAREQMIESARRAELRYQDAVLKTQFQRTLKMPTESVDQMQYKLERLKTLLASMGDLGLLSPAQIVQAEQTIQRLTNEISSTIPVQQQAIQLTQQQIEANRQLGVVTAETTQREHSFWMQQVRGGIEAQAAFSKYKQELQNLSATKGEDAATRSLVDNYTKLNDMLSKLRQGYNNLSEAQKRSSRGQEWAQSIAQLEQIVPKVVRLGQESGIASEKVKQIKAEMADLGEKIKFAIEKMGFNNAREDPLIKQLIQRQQELQKLLKSYEQIATANDKTAKEGKKASDVLADYGKNANNAATANEKVAKSAERVVKENTRMSQTIEYIQKRIAYLITTFGTMNFVRQLIDVRAEFETMERSLGVLMDSAERGTQIFNELNQMALNSPFTTLELGGAARQLLAYGVAANDLVDTTKRLADISSAVGTPIERIAYALGQVQTYGYLTSLQAKTFMRAGIPLVKELAEMYSQLEGRIVSTGDVYERMKDKAVSYHDVLMVINKDTDDGGRFFNYQAKMASTLKVQLANLHLAYENMLNDIGKSNQSLITSPIKLLRTLFANWKSISDAITAVAVAYGAAKVAGMLYTTYLRGSYVVETKSLVNSQKYNYQLKERILASRGLSVAEKERVMTMRAALTKEYEQRIASEQWTAAQVKKRIAIDRGNVALIEAATNMGLLTAKEREAYIATVGLSKGWMRFANFLKANWLFLVITAVTELIFYINGMDEKINEFNDDLIEGAKQASDAYKNLLNTMREAGTFREGDKSQGEAAFVITSNVADQETAWEEFREKIIEVSASSVPAIAKIEKAYDKTSDKLQKGIEYLKEAEEALLKISSVGGTKVEFDEGSWFAFINHDWISAGTVTYLEDTREAIQNVTKAYGDASEVLSRYHKGLIDDSSAEYKAAKGLDTVYQRLIDSVDKTVLSMRDKMAENGFILGETSGEQYRVAFNYMLEKLIEDFKIPTELQADYRTIVEQRMLDWYYAEWTNIYKKTEDSQKEMVQQNYKTWRKGFDAGQNAWNAFWDKVRRENNALLTELAQKGVDESYWATEEGKKHLDDWLKKFRDNNELAFRDLQDKVNLANMLTVTIQVWYKEMNKDALEKSIRNVIGAEGGEIKLDGAKDTYEYVQKLNQEWDEINTRIDYYNSRTNLTDDEKKKLENLIARRKELEQQRKILNAPHSKQENKDIKEQLREKKRADKAAEIAEKKRLAQEKKDKKAAEMAAKKAEQERIRKQREAEQELNRALQDEVQIVDKIRTTYEKLRKTGISPERIATDMFVNFDETIKDLNKSLKKYGVEEFSLFDIINPDSKLLKSESDISDFFSAQLDKVKKSGKYTREAYKALEQELFKIWESFSINTMSLLSNIFDKNIDKLNEQYELALDVEESPELADLLSSMMHVDISDLLEDAPRTLREFTEKVNDTVDGALRAYYENMDKTLNEEGIKIKMADIFGNDGLNILDNQTFEKIREELGVDSELYKQIEKLRKDLISKNRKFFEDVEKTYNDYLKKHGDFADKVRDIENKKFADLKQLDEVYNTDTLKSTYDYTRKREAILQSEREAIQKLKFDEFKDSETYLLLFEDLENVSSTTMTMIINKLHDMRKELTELDPSELKKLVEYEEKLRSQMLKRNPLKDLKKDWKEYIKLQKNRKQIEENAIKSEQAVEDQENIVRIISTQLEAMKAMNLYGTIQYEMKETELKNEQDLLKLKKKINNEDKYQLHLLSESEVDMRNRAAGMAVYLGYAMQTLDAIKSIADESGNIDFQNAVEATSDVVGNLQAAAQGYAQGGWIGAVAAGISDLVPKIVKWANKETQIDKALQKSELRVKALDNSLKDLSHTVEQTYGAYTIAAQNAVIENKKLQLEELRRQLRLEQSRRRKKQDKSKIADLKGQIIDLRNEINDATKDVVNNLLDISSGGDWAENLVSSIIEAFKQGEQAMDKFSDSWDNMIDHMMMKWLVSQYLQRWWDDVLNNVKIIEERYTKELAAEKARMQTEYDNVSLMSGYNEDSRVAFMNMFYKFEEGRLKETEAGLSFMKYLKQHGFDENDMAGFTYSHGYKLPVMDAAREWYTQYMTSVISDIDSQMNQASMDAIPEIVEYLNRVKPQGESIINQLYDSLGQYFTFGESADKTLSQLQQGIQGITEDTAGALEAYMNGVSQQVYFQSDLLTQIRDSLFGLDPNLVMGIQSQMLLELQNSYQIQVAIQTLLQGWSAADGNSVKVTLV